MGIEWGKGQVPVMDLLLIEQLAAHNSADFEAIVQIIGIQNLIKCLPHVLSIYKTYQGQAAQQPKKGSV